MEGTMQKRRNCNFIQLTAYVDNVKPVELNLLDSKNRTTRVVGYQLWGPWGIATRDHKTVQIYSRHQCHFMWQQEQKLADLSLS